MAEFKKVALVTGGNKGIGFDVVRQLASKGITVLLTARDESRGRDAVKKLKDSGELSGEVIFHQLDVADPISVILLTEFIKAKFGRLDILVNNAGVAGAEVDMDAARASGRNINWREILIQTYESAVVCFQTNYYGVKRMIEALFPLLHMSDSARIVNVSSQSGELGNLRKDWAKEILSNVDELTEDRIHEVVIEYLKDLKEGVVEAKGWPIAFGAYRVSKVAMNAYTRMVAKRLHHMKVNCVCPGYVKTDLNLHSGILSVEEGAEKIVRVAMMPDDGPSGAFFIKGEVCPF